jgi:hypothetical protein
MHNGTMEQSPCTVRINASVRSIIEDPESHHRSKLISTHYFLVHDQQELRTIKMAKVSSHDDVMDMFKKALPREFSSEIARG